MSTWNSECNASYFRNWIKYTQFTLTSNTLETPALYITSLLAKFCWVASISDLSTASIHMGYFVRNSTTTLTLSCLSGYLEEEKWINHKPKKYCWTQRHTRVFHAICITYNVQEIRYSASFFTTLFLPELERRSPSVLMAPSRSEGKSGNLTKIGTPGRSFLLGTDRFLPPAA